MCSSCRILTKLYQKCLFENSKFSRKKIVGTLVSTKTQLQAGGCSGTALCVLFKNSEVDGSKLHPASLLRKWPLVTDDVDTITSAIDNSREPGRIYTPLSQK